MAGGELGGMGMVGKGWQGKVGHNCGPGQHPYRLKL